MEIAKVREAVSWKDSKYTSLTAGWEGIYSVHVAPPTELLWLEDRGFWISAQLQNYGMDKFVINMSSYKGSTLVQVQTPMQW